MTAPWTQAQLLEQPLKALRGLWLCIRCSGCSKSTDSPLKLVAARARGNVTLGAALARLRCSVCGSPPAYAWVCDDPNDSGLGGRRQSWRVDVVPVLPP